MVAVVSVEKAHKGHSHGLVQLFVTFREIKARISGGKPYRGNEALSLALDPRSSTESEVDFSYDGQDPGGGKAGVAVYAEGCTDAPADEKGRGQQKRTLGWTLEIVKNAQNRKFFPAYVGKFGQQLTQLFYYYFSFIVMRMTSIWWHSELVQETLEKPDYRPCLVWCECEFSEVWSHIFTDLTVSSSTQRIRRDHAESAASLARKPLGLFDVWESDSSSGSEACQDSEEKEEGAGDTDVIKVNQYSNPFPS